MIIGYTAGVFDLFHVGHLNLLRNAKSMCDALIVGVTTDELAEQRGKRPVIPFEQRIDIVRNMKCVNAAIAQSDMDKVKMCKKLSAKMLFVGDDWYASSEWESYEEKLSEIGVMVIYFPYTSIISSSEIKCRILGENKEKNGRI